VWLIHDVVASGWKNGTAVQHAWYMHIFQIVIDITRITIFHDPVPSRWRGTGSYIYAANHSFEMRATLAPVKTVFSFSSMGHFCSMHLGQSESVRHPPIVAQKSNDCTVMTRSHKIWADRLEYINTAHDTFCMKLLQLTHYRSPMHMDGIRGCSLPTEGKGNFTV